MNKRIKICYKSNIIPNKAFTLIELLAVIVILAFIAIIATPIIVNIISDSRQSASQRSAEMYIKALEQAIARENFDKEYNPSGCVIENSKLICDSEELNVEVDNSIPTCGNINISDGKITSYALNIQGYYVKKDDIGNIAIESTTDCPLNITVELPKGLTPVIYKNNNWVIISEDSEEWYDYENQEWANAVILSNETKKIGDSIKVDGSNPDVYAMFVWIPRYEYRIEGAYGIHSDGTEGTSELPGEVKINFISKSKTTPSNGYIVHPAFIFGEEQLNGIWVGKFEISHNTIGNSSEKNNLKCSTENCQIADGIRILPNVYSLKYNNISNFFFAIRSMSREGNAFGIVDDTHMIKNSERGAVVYLSQSKYGKYGNPNYEGVDKEIYTNNSGSFWSHPYYTGRSSGSSKNTSYTSQGACKYDNTENNCGIGASTTGNITGIYDMSYGSWEYAMGVYSNEFGDLWSGYSEEHNSGFTGKLGYAGTDYIGVSFPESKYYDLYQSTSGTNISLTTACNGGICYGHALSETYKWYNRSISVVSSSWPWYAWSNPFGCNHISGGSRDYTGSSTSHISTRVVLTLK